MGGSARIPYAGASLIALDSPVGPVWSFPDVDQSAIQNGEPVKGRCNLLDTRAHFWLLDEFGESAAQGRAEIFGDSDAQGRAEQTEQAEQTKQAEQNLRLYASRTTSLATRM